MHQRGSFTLPDPVIAWDGHIELKSEELHPGEAVEVGAVDAFGADLDDRLLVGVPAVSLQQRHDQILFQQQQKQQQPPQEMLFQKSSKFVRRPSAGNISMQQDPDVFHLLESVETPQFDEMTENDMRKCVCVCVCFDFF